LHIVSLGLDHTPSVSEQVSFHAKFCQPIFSRPYLSNSRAIGMVVVRPSVRP